MINRPEQAPVMTEYPVAQRTSRKSLRTAAESVVPRSCQRGMGGNSPTVRAAGQPRAAAASAWRMMSAESTRRFFEGYDGPGYPIGVVSRASAASSPSSRRSRCNVYVGC